ncbi:30S ribosomal protein S8 [Candidatus Woesebacteria bacterium]|jgi:small subunit ribosomal protein S8|nr:30S ribosomal protein S8 [Candidatus Woesebacteria bacterium]
MIDPVSDLIIRIKNAVLARKIEVRLPHSKMKQAVAEILAAEGYVTAVATEPAPVGKELVITLKYVGKQSFVTDVRRLSKPGRRLYSPATQIPKTLGGYGITIVSTNKGVMTDKEARKQNVGGELLCQIW